MRRRDFWSEAMRTVLGGAACWTCGCGTLMHPERQGRPHGRDLDWQVVALNGLGLVLFFVPGVMAFVVDFATGAIYLPPEPPEPPYPPTREFDGIAVPRDQLEPDRIEAEVGNHVGRPVSLSEPGTRVSRLSGLERFHDQCRRHCEDGTFGVEAATFLAEIRMG